MYKHKYFQNIYLYFYIHNKYTQYTYIYNVNKNLFWMQLIAINRLTALIIIILYYHNLKMNKYEKTLSVKYTDLFRWELFILWIYSSIFHKYRNC